MFPSKDDSLSPDEFRKRLYRTFKEKGMLDSLKTQLRNQLIQELKPQPLSGSEPESAKPESLLVSACNNIVADHLRTSGYEYSLSVFCPESGLCKEKVLSKGDLLQLLRISPQSELYTSLSPDKENDSKGFLINLLTQLAHHCSPSHGHDADTQTNCTGAHGESLVEKLKLIDKQYEGADCGGDRWSFQSKLATYRKELETQMQTEMNTKMQHFKNVEISKVKMEEKAQFQKEFDKLKQDLDRTYEMKVRGLIEREKNAIDRLQRQQEIEERNVYMQRQSVLKEIEAVRNRESELKLRAEAFEKTCQIHQEKVKSTEELLRRREVAVKTLEDTHEQRLQNELSRYQRELKDEFAQRTEKLVESENRNRVETTRIQKESAEIDAKLEEQSRVCTELTRLQVDLETALQQASLLGQQKELLRERLDAMSDYPAVRKEKSQLQGQVNLLRKQLEEAQEENRLLHADLGKPSKEQLALQMELRRLQSTRRLEEEEFDSQKQVLQEQLQSEVERCAKFKAQLIESEEKSRWMNNHIQALKTQLRQTQQALENEVLRNRPAADGRAPPDIYAERPAPRAAAAVGHAAVCEAGGGQQRGLRAAPRGGGGGGDSPSADREVAQAKARIQKLLEEADCLDEAYRSYQQRAVRSTVSSHLLPRTPQLVDASPPRRNQQRSLHRSKVSHRAASPQRGATPPSPPRSARLTTERTPRPGVEDPPRDQPSPAYRRRSSSSHSSSRRKHQTELTEAASPPAQSWSPEAPPPPAKASSTSADTSSDLSSPRSPQMKSTARDPPSLGAPSGPPPPPVFSSPESTPPQPEKINVEDLTGGSPEPGRIPELLLDTAGPLSEEAPDGPPVPRPLPPRDLPESPADSRSQGESPQDTGVFPAEIGEEDASQRWERERREKQEKRQREQEEARERERQELERLERETMEQQTQEEEEEGAAAVKGGGVMQEEEEEEEELHVPRDNPLEKYMRMVLEAREKKRAQSPGREEAALTSPEPKSLSEEKDASIASYSHKDEEDDFW